MSDEVIWQLIEFQELNLKSLDDYLKAANFLFQFSEIQDYIQTNIIPISADWPGQLYIRSAITQKILKLNNNIPDQITKLVPLIDLGERIFPCKINLLLYLSYGGWKLVRQEILKKFKLCKDIEYATSIDLLDNIIPSVLDIYGVLFRGGFFDEYIETLFRVWTFMARFKRKNYDKAILAFLSDIFYWNQINHPIYNFIRQYLSLFHDSYVENFHSLLCRYTSDKGFDPKRLRRDALVIDTEKHNNNFLNAFVEKKKYPYSKKNIDCMLERSAIFLLQYFESVWNNLGKTQKLTKRKANEKQYYDLPTMGKLWEVALPTAFLSSHIPNTQKFCDANFCKILDQNIPSYFLTCDEKNINDNDEFIIFQNDDSANKQLTEALN
ncbi:8578_t:CDS:2, partial [Entrophospora sp. SA101]